MGDRAMTKQEAMEEDARLSAKITNWHADDDWHLAMYERIEELTDYWLCSNGKDPGPWEMPSVPEGVEP